MIILLHLKLDKFYCTEVMNYLKLICSFVHTKMSYYWFNRYKLLQKAKVIVVVKLLSIILKTVELKKKKYIYIYIYKYKNLSEEVKKAKREYGKNRYRNMKEKTS